MGKKYYIASGLENAAAVKDLKAVLDAAGWQHTYDWTVHGSVQHDRGLLVDVAQAEENGVNEAEVVIVLLPGGRGTHVELGMAIVSAVATSLGAAAGMIDGGQDPRICIFSPNPDVDFGTTGKTCAFYWHPLVERFTSMDEMIKALVGQGVN